MKYFLKTFQSYWSDSDADWEFSNSDADFEFYISDADWNWHIERASRRRKLMLTTPGPPLMKMSKRGPPRFNTFF